MKSFWGGVVKATDAKAADVKAADVKAAAEESIKSSAAEAAEKAEKIGELNAYWERVIRGEPKANIELERLTIKAVSWWQHHEKLEVEQVPPNVGAALKALEAAGIGDFVDINAVQKQIATTSTARPKGFTGGR